MAITLKTTQYLNVTTATKVAVLRALGRTNLRVAGSPHPIYIGADSSVSPTTGYLAATYEFALDGFAGEVWACSEDTVTPTNITVLETYTVL